MRLPLADLLPHGKARCVVVDVETSGLDLARDSLIAIGAVAVNELALDLDDCFEIVLRQEKASAEAIEFLQYVTIRPWWRSAPSSTKPCCSARCARYSARNAPAVHRSRVATAGALPRKGVP
jgi:hypothetical protein